MEDADDPMPFWEMRGYSCSQLPRLEVEPAHDVNPPKEIAFVPQSMLDDEFQPGPRHIQGEIKLPERVREGLLQAERMQPDADLVPDEGGNYPSPELADDINHTQPVERPEPAIGGEGQPPFHKLGGGT